MPWNTPHRIQYAVVPDPAVSDLPGDHSLALFFITRLNDNIFLLSGDRSYPSENPSIPEALPNSAHLPPTAGARHLPGGIKMRARLPANEYRHAGILRIPD